MLREEVIDKGDSYCLMIEKMSLLEIRHENVQSMLSKEINNKEDCVCS